MRPVGAGTTGGAGASAGAGAGAKPADIVLNVDFIDLQAKVGCSLCDVVFACLLICRCLSMPVLCHFVCFISFIPFVLFVSFAEGTVVVCVRRHERCLDV